MNTLDLPTLSPLQDYLLDEWEAWIEIQEHEDERNMLYIIGDIFWPLPVIKPALVKKDSEKLPPRQLHLEIRPGILWDDGPIEEISYSEISSEPFLYEEVFIYAGEVLLAHICQIEKTGQEQR
jgi:hypothetical protein